MAHAFVRLLRSAGGAALLLTLLLVPSLTAAAVDRDRDRDRDRAGKGKREGNAALQQTLDFALIDVNNVLTVIDNQGVVGQDPRTAGPFGFFPANSPNNYIFGTGMWVGGIVNGTRTTAAFYDPSGPAEGLPGRDPANGSGGGQILCSDDAAERAQWYPEFSDASGNPIVFSQKDCIVIFTDNNPGLDVTTPIGLEVRQRSMAFTFGLLSQVVFIVWDVVKTGDSTLEDAFLGVGADMDIGSNAQDDRCSAIPVVPPGPNNSSSETAETNLGFCWDFDFNEADFNPNPPGFVGITFFQGPVNEAGDSLGLTRFTLTTNASLGRPQPDPNTDGDQYDLMAGAGVRAPFIDATATDVRFVHISGPVRMEPGDAQRVVVGYIWADVSNGRRQLDVSPTRCFPSGTPCFLPDPNDPALEELVTIQRAAQVIFDAGFLAPAPPPKPDITLIPGDGQVTVVWSDVSQEPDPFFTVAGDPANPAFDPLFREFDFEGFVLVRSTSGDPGDIDTLGVFDLSNGVNLIQDTTFQTFTVVDSTGTDTIVTTLPTQIRTLATLSDQGLQFSFVDRGLINGIVYFYDVVPFDFNPSNTLRGPEISLSAGISFQPRDVRSIRPRSDATSFQAADVRFNALKADGTVCDTEEPTATIDPETGAYLDLVDCSNAIQATVTPLRDVNIPSGEFFFVIDSVLPGAFDPTDNNANTDTGERGYIIAEGTNIVWFHWEDAGGNLATTIQPNSGSFNNGTLFVTPRFSAASQAPLSFALDSNTGDVGPDLSVALVVSQDFSVLEDLEINGQSLTNLDLGGTDSERRPHAIAGSSLADEVLLSFDRKVNAIRDYAPYGDYAPGSASFELTWEVDGGSYTGTLRRLPGGEVVPLGGQPKGAANPSTPDDFTAGYNWGFVSGTPDALAPLDVTGCTAAVFGGTDCGTIKEALYPAGGPLTNSISLTSGASFAITVPGHYVYVEGIHDLPETGDTWTFRMDAGPDRGTAIDGAGHGREPIEEAGAPPFSYADAGNPFVPQALAPFNLAVRNVYPGARWRLSLAGGSNDPSAADLSQIRTVPNPYVANAPWDFSQDNQRVEFIHLPPECTIRIYTISGNLVRVIEHTNGSGTEVWDLRTRFNLKAATGSYYWHVTTPDGRTALGLMSLIQNEIGAN